MRMTRAEIEAKILSLLRDGPIRQCEIADYLPIDQYIEVGQIIRKLAARGVIARERDGTSYIVSIKESEERTS